MKNLEHFANESQERFTEIHEVTVPNLEAKLQDEISNERIERVKLDFCDFLVSTLHLDKKQTVSMLFTAVHRLPGGRDNKNNIILRLSNLMDRDEILEAAYKLPKGSGFSVVPDVPRSVSERRSSLLRDLGDMPVGERKKYKLVYTKEFPFVVLKKG